MGCRASSRVRIPPFPPVKQTPHQSNLVRGFVLGIHWREVVDGININGSHTFE
jgi:hypothetical protein